MTLYTPTRREIDHAAETAAALAPSLWSRLVYAGCILRAGDLVWNGEGWTCRGAANPAAVYTVDFAGCTCPDCAGRRALLGGEGCCAHRLALLLYTDVCLAHLRGRLLGPTTDPAARAAAAEHPNAALLTLRYAGGCRLALCTAVARRPLPTPLCQMVKVGGGLGFAAERDLAAFAAWLAGARPLPQGERETQQNAAGPVRVPPALLVRPGGWTRGAIV